MSENVVRFTPTLAINRLLIFRKGQAVYDQEFHHGVNIIRGTNGSGKSTIMDFIFHVLGGEVLGPTIQEWKEYASLCDAVVAEITVNDAVVTLRREVTPERSRPLHIFFDRFEIASRSVAEGWQTFPYSRQGSKGIIFSDFISRASDA
jgi:AAA domain